jgi:N-acetyl-anhydromuramyl-L-alanine amidase AmpD
MRSVSGVLLVFATALLLAGTSAAAVPPNELASAQNYTKAKRKPGSIRFIVIHVTEGSFLGAISWLRDPRAHASVNFVVARTGEVQKLVPLHDIAWHAGNWAVNKRSIGIENEGFTKDPIGYPLAQYKATATIAGRVARQSLIPIDRRHIIGHSDVPDPNDPLQGGGIDGHSDPGPYWNWALFMKLVRQVAFPEHRLERTHVGLQVQSSTLYGGQVIAGKAPWRAKIGGPVTKVSFVVDGKVRWNDHVKPFAFAGGKMWSTFGLRNGKHRLELRAYGSKGSWTRHRFTLRVKNEPFTLSTVGLKPQQQVTGVVPVESLFTGVPPARVRLVLDGREIDHDTSPPYVFKWDTRRVKDGKHVLTLLAKSRDGRLVRSSIPVVVANGLVQAPALTASSLVDGQTVSGVQHWLVEASGTVARVEFLVDGAVRSTTAAPPYAWDWDTAQDAPGTHALVVRAVGSDGTVAEQKLSVTVAPR